MQRLLAPVLASLLLASPATAAEPVFLAPVVSGLPDQGALATVVEARTRDRLLDGGWVVLDAPVVGDHVPREAVRTCAGQPIPCAAGVMPTLPVRLGVMARVDRLGDATLGHVEVLASGGTRPLAVSDVPIVAGQEDRFAQSVVEVLDRVAATLGPAPSALFEQAAALVAPQARTESMVLGAAPPERSPSDTEDPNREVVPPSTPAIGRAPAASPSAQGRRPPSMTPEAAGIPRRRFAGATERLERSGLHPLDFLYRATPHAGQAIVELRAGFGMGDVDRQLLLRDEVRDGTLTDQWYREAPASGTDFLGGAYVGYAPITALDVGLLVGFQYATRVVNAQTLTLTGPGDTPNREEPALSLVQAIDVVIQPRLRLYAVSLGPVKPFVVAGAEAKLFQSYQLPGNGIAPDGGWIPGAVGGVGIVVDPGPLVGLFAEGSYTLHFGPRTAEVSRSESGNWPWVSSEPSLLRNQGGTVTVTGGVQFRL